MQMVIEIPDRFVKDRDGLFIDDVYKATQEVTDVFFESILKGTPLPEHHGRISDVGNAERRILKYMDEHKDERGEGAYAALVMLNVETIIPATKEGETT